MSSSPDSTSLKPTPPPSRSPSEALPIELWLLIFEDKGLAYGDYKRIERVCKDFRKLLQSHSLDDRLFRSPLPAQPVKRGTKVTFHPALDRANLVCSSTQDAHVFINAPGEKHGFKPVSILDYPCAVEYATSPSSRKIKMNMGAGVEVANKEGVKVRDIVEATPKMWSSRPPNYIRQQVVAQLSIWDPELKAADLTWRDTLGDHCFWEGMRSASVASEDEVLLEER
ncbi:hypothetical protein JCM10207_005437 [Rhodosporidiobolus poonsookiae]